MKIFLSISILLLSLTAFSQFTGGNGSGYTSGIGGGIGECTSSATVAVDACDAYTLPSGSQTVTSSGTYLDTIPNLAGCDSFLTLQVTITTIDTTVAGLGNTLIANQSGATYQWLDCINGFTPVPGETGQSFVPSVTGNYAAIVAVGNCADTTECVTVLVSAVEPSLGGGIRLYPNPTSGRIRIDMGVEVENMEVSIMDIAGRTVLRKEYSHVIHIELHIPGAAGIYLVQVRREDHPPVIVKVERH